METGWRRFKKTPRASSSTPPAPARSPRRSSSRALYAGTQGRRKPQNRARRSARLARQPYYPGGCAARVPRCPRLPAAGLAGPARAALSFAGVPSPSARSRPDGASGEEASPRAAQQWSRGWACGGAQPSPRGPPWLPAGRGWDPARGDGGPGSTELCAGEWVAPRALGPRAASSQPPHAGESAGQGLFASPPLGTVEAAQPVPAEPPESRPGLICTGSHAVDLCRGVRAHGPLDENAGGEAERREAVAPIACWKPWRKV